MHEVRGPEAPCPDDWGTTAGRGEAWGPVLTFGTTVVVVLLLVAALAVIIL